MRPRALPIAARRLALLLGLAGCTPPALDDAAGDSGQPLCVQDDTAADSDSSVDEAVNDTGDSGGPSAPDFDLSLTADVPSDEFVLLAVRHAEKDSGSDPGLTEAGQARAQALAVQLAGVPLNTVYATTYRRTQETVQPTADDHGLPVLTDIDPYRELATHLLSQHQGDVVLHSGHSFTLPTFMAALGVGLGEFQVSGYGQLWIVHVDNEGCPHIIETRFGD